MISQSPQKPNPTEEVKFEHDVMFVYACGCDRCIELKEYLFEEERKRRDAHWKTIIENLRVWMFSSLEPKGLEPSVVKMIKEDFDREFDNIVVGDKTQ